MAFLWKSVLVEKVPIWAKKQWCLKCLLWLCQWAGSKSVKKERTVQFTVPCRRNPILFVFYPYLSVGCSCPCESCSQILCVDCLCAEIENSLPFKAPSSWQQDKWGMSESGLWELWHSFLCPLPPAMALTASRSPVWSFKVLAKLLTEQSLKDECPCLLGRAQIAQTCFFAPTLEIWSLEE